MLFDARRVPRGETLEYDICIVGAGAAGITVAQEFNGGDHRVLLLEGGGLRASRAAQRLYSGQVVDPRHHAPLDRYRVRRFGGTTTVWGGCCAPFDATDFQTRPHVPYSGWPITKADLDPYYARAHLYCELGSYTYEATALPGTPRPAIPGMTAPDVVSDKLWLFSPPTNFGKSYLSALRQSRNVDVCLHGNALKLLADPPYRVDCVKVASRPGHEFRVRARVFVLAAGALESARLLLVSDDVHRRGIGNAHDLVGRFYMGHLSGDVGEVELKPRGGEAVWHYETTVDGVYCRRRLSIDPARQERDALLNFAAILDRPLPADPSHRDGVLSALFLIKQLSHWEPGYSLRCTAAHCVNVVADAGRIARFSAELARKRLLSARRLPSVMLRGKGNAYTLHFDAEQSPNPESRVMLGESRDAFGLRRLKVDWRYSDADVESAVRSAMVIDGALRQAGIGRILLGPQAMHERISEMARGGHQLGTTRMAVDPIKGVVDGDCRVHGIANLYIASCSVFATASYARPTLTAVALAIRLADHVKALFDRTATGPGAAVNGVDLAREETWSRDEREIPSPARARNAHQGSLVGKTAT
jgi:choline dehydrogenase-like flavoprotein